MTKKQRKKRKKSLSVKKTDQGPAQHLEELNWRQINDLDRRKSVFFLPLSPMEEHGPHLPVGTDLMVSQDIAAEAIKTLSKKNNKYDFIILPSVPIGYSKIASGFPGTISVSSRAIRDVVYGIGQSLAEHGFRYLVICTYHMDFVHLKGIYAGMRKIRRRHPHMKVCEPCGPFFYQKVHQQREPKIDFDTSKEVHAGFRETSLMRYLYPYLVDEKYKELSSVFADLDTIKAWGKLFQELGVKEGYVGSPQKANIEYGRWLFKETVNEIVEATRRLYGDKKQRQLPRRIRWLMRLLPF